MAEVEQTTRSTTGERSEAEGHKIPDELGRLCRDLQRDLGEFGYQWLAACSVYPALLWNLTVYLGTVLAEAKGEPPPSEETHMALARLAWFRKGEMPDDLRLRLIRDLTPENRKVVREALERLFYHALEVQPTPQVETYDIDVTRPPSSGWRALFQVFLSTGEPDDPEQDLIFVRYMMGRKPRELDLRLDRALRRLFGARLSGWLDSRAILGLLFAVITAAALWLAGNVWLGPRLSEFVSVRTDFVPLEAFRECNVCPEMVMVSAGEFVMGSPDSEESRDDDEGPQRRVLVGAFAIGRYPVTLEEYDDFAEATGRGKPSDQGWGRGRRPVINVSWEDAQAYVGWLSEKTGQTYRLPSEAEWEYAARAGTETRYAFGDEITERQANFGENVGKTTEVGAYPANAWGLYDMHGNVLEWVEDCWHDSYKGAPEDGTAWTETWCPGRVVRGGSWYDVAGILRSALRLWDQPVIWVNYLGFRVARTLDR